MDGEGPIKDERTKLLQKEASSSVGPRDPGSPKKCCCSIIQAGMEQCWSALVYGDDPDDDSTRYLGPESSSSGGGTSSSGAAPLAMPEEEGCPSPHKVAKYESTSQTATSRQHHKSHFKPFLPSCLGDRSDGKGCGLFTGCDSRFSHTHEQSSYTMAGGTDTGGTDDISPASDSSSPVKDTFPYSGPKCEQKTGSELKVHSKDPSGGGKGSGRGALEDSRPILEGEEHYRLPPCKYCSLLL